jgi:hypothetical protein
MPCYPGYHKLCVATSSCRCNEKRPGLESEANVFTAELLMMLEPAVLVADDDGGGNAIR